MGEGRIHKFIIALLLSLLVGCGASEPSTNPNDAFVAVNLQDPNESSGIPPVIAPKIVDESKFTALVAQREGSEIFDTHSGVHADAFFASTDAQICSIDFITTDDNQEIRGSFLDYYADPLVTQRVVTRNVTVYDKDYSLLVDIIIACEDGRRQEFTISSRIKRTRKATL